MTGSDIREKMVYLVQFQLTRAPVILVGTKAEVMCTSYWESLSKVSSCCPEFPAALPVHCITAAQLSNHCSFYRHATCIPNYLYKVTTEL